MNGSYCTKFYNISMDKYVQTFFSRLFRVVTVLFLIIVLYIGGFLFALLGDVGLFIVRIIFLTILMILMWKPQLEEIVITYISFIISYVISVFLIACDLTFVDDLLSIEWHIICDIINLPYCMSQSEMGMYLYQQAFVLHLLIWVIIAAIGRVALFGYKRSIA